MPRSRDDTEYDFDIVWQHEHPGVKGFSSIAVDSTGTIYACGVAPDEEHGVVVKYSPDGDVQWEDTSLPRPLDAATYRSVATNTSTDAAPAALPAEERYGAFMDIAVDGAGNVIVAGSFCQTEPLRVYIMVQKYRPDGTVIWSSTYTRRLLNHAMGVAVDGNNDIFVVGQGGIGLSLLQPNTITLKALAMKIAGSSGRVLWARTRRKGQYMWFHDAAVDGDGNLLVSGYFLSGEDIRPVISRFNGRNGLWTRYLEPPGHNIKVSGIARRIDGDFHAVGAVDAPRIEDIAPYLLRFSPDLALLWDAHGETNGYLYGTDVLPDDNIVATGMDFSRNQYYAAIYDAATGQKRQDLYLGPIHATGINFNDYLKGVAADPEGNVVCAGAWNPGIVMKIRLAGTGGTGERYVLQVQIEPRGGGSVSPSGGTFPAGKTISLQAHASKGYAFSHWSGDASGSAATTSISMDADKTVVAHFTQREEPTSWLQRLLQWLFGR